MKDIAYSSFVNFLFSLRTAFETSALSFILKMVLWMHNFFKKIGY
jgi:hypothetical protein